MKSQSVEDVEEMGEISRLSVSRGGEIKEVREG